MFERTLYRPIEVDFRAWLRANHNIELPATAYIMVSHKEWEDAPEGKGYYMPSAVLYELGTAKFADVKAFADALQALLPLEPDGVRKDVNRWYNLANFAARECVERLELD
jgi:hypothetical protein